MAEKTPQSDGRAGDEREAAHIRRQTQDRDNPSGHGMQVTPRQQEHIAESSDNPSGASAAEYDDDALEDLKGDNRP